MGIEITGSLVSTQTEKQAVRNPVQTEQSSCHERLGKAVDLGQGVAGCPIDHSGDLACTVCLRIADDRGPGRDSGLHAHEGRQTAERHQPDQKLRDQQRQDHGQQPESIESGEIEERVELSEHFGSEQKIITPRNGAASNNQR